MPNNNGGVIAIKGMENMNTMSTIADELQAEQEVIDDQLERVVQDFNEFRERVSQQNSSSAMKLEELVDLYICSGGDNAYGCTSQDPAQVSDDHLEEVVQDFNKFRERILQSSSVNGMKLEELVDWYIYNGGDNMDSYTSHNTAEQFITCIDESYQFDNVPRLVSANNQAESEEIIDRMADHNTSCDASGCFCDSYQMGGNPVTYIRYGHLNSHEAAATVIGSIFGGDSAKAFELAVSFLNPTRGCKRKRVKRKYRKTESF